MTLSIPALIGAAGTAWLAGWCMHAALVSWRTWRARWIAVPSTERQLANAARMRRAELRTTWSAGIRIQPVALDDFDHGDTRP